MKNVLLVFGGKSYEHDISVVTASQIYNKTRLDDVKLIPLYLSRNNEFYVYTAGIFDIKDFSRLNFKNSSKKFKEVSFVSGEKCRLFAKTRFGLKEYLYAEDIVFACHGGLGENGELVAFFKEYGFGTSAGNIDSLSICMNKYLFKQTMKGLKIPVVQGFKITKNDYMKNFEEFKYRLKFLHFPIIMKSNNGGSSIGLFVVKNRKEFDEKLKQSFEFDDEVLIENYCEKAREFNVAIIGNSDSFDVSEIDEPVKLDEVLSFSDKYLSGGKGKKNVVSKNSMVSQVRKFPADIPLDLSNKIKLIAAKVFKNLGLSGVVRIDFLYQQNSNKLYVCEVNAIPGSLAYYFFANNKITTNNLVQKLIEISAMSRQKETCLNKEYFTNILD